MCAGLLHKQLDGNSDIHAGGHARLRANLYERCERLLRSAEAYLILPVRHSVYSRSGILLSHPPGNDINKQRYSSRRSRIWSRSCTRRICHCTDQLRQSKLPGAGLYRLRDQLPHICIHFKPAANRCSQPVHHLQVPVSKSCNWHDHARKHQVGSVEWNYSRSGCCVSEYACSSSNEETDTSSTSDCRGSDSAVGIGKESHEGRSGLPI